MINENGYQEKILVFFDVLGFKDLILNKYKNEPEKIEDILSTMHLLSDSSYPSELFIFSDSVINILEAKPHFEKYEQTFSDYLDVIFGNIATIQMSMVSLYGVLIRGSIVIGNIKYSNEKNILFGPALINAYDLESKYSVYPRFILDKSIVELIEKDIGWLDVSQDIDGLYYVDSFKWLVKLEAEKEWLIPIKEKIKREISNLGEAPNIGVLSKYYWFLNKILEREQKNFIKIK